MSKDYQIAVYYFPNYHPDPRNAQVHGPRWTEWELVKRAEPRFAGHRQPRVPLWGYENEADPAVMAKKITAAADHGIDVFLFDWYYYADGPFLEQALEKGFLNAPNCDQLKFAIHWANHDWQDIHPVKLDEIRSGTWRVLYQGTLNLAAFKQMTNLIIERYFKHPSYWKIDGAPYFSIYDLPGLVHGLGSVNATRQALADFRARTIAAGFPDLHLNQVLWNHGVLPGEKIVRQPGVMLSELGFSSFTSYTWVHHAQLNTFPETSYTEIFKNYMEYWNSVSQDIHLPYFPNASQGWDPSPRTLPSDSWIEAGYPYTPLLSGGTPERFQAALQAIKDRLDLSGGPKIVTINAWNEWTEGSYLEPDTESGYAYLEAVREVFGKD